MMTINQGNVFKVIHQTGCTLKEAEEALSNSNSWQDTYKYVREHKKAN